MFAMPGLRAFAVSADPSANTVSCNGQGVFVGHAPLLEQIDGFWRPRPTAELNQDLTNCYRLPVDITAKANALALIAHALNRGDLAMAAIAAVQMQIPNPPLLTKGSEPFDETMRRAAELRRAGLLKDWDPAKHPRTGTPPNRAWFAPVSHSENESIQVAVRPDPHNPWTVSPDSEGGGGGGNAENLFPDKLPYQLKPYEQGEKTYGIFKTPDGDEEALQSGTQGPAANMPPGSLGFDGYTKTHVEGQAAALMWQRGIDDATLFINNPEICDSCMSLLPRMLPPGATLRVILSNGAVMEFKGIPR
jgi:hypothetical protein